MNVLKFIVTLCIVDGVSNVLASHICSDNVDIPLLTEKDIPGASFNGEDPSELNVIQLKRWLICRDAPTTGKKPELIQRYG